MSISCIVFNSDPFVQVPPVILYYLILNSLKFFFKAWFAYPFSTSLVIFCHYLECRNIYE